MLKHILLAVQGEESDGFWEKIAGVLQLLQPRVTVLHVSETALAHYGYVDQLASSITKEQFIQYIHHIAGQKQHEIRERFQELVRQRNVPWEWKVREGDPAREIERELAGGTYDLLILGSKPASPGNTSSKVKEKMLARQSTSLLIIK